VPLSTMKPSRCNALRRWAGQRTQSLCVLGFAVVLTVVGTLSLPPMIGDEVTHFYMLDHQAETLPRANFAAPIPASWRPLGVEVRYYPHAMLWHYALSIPYHFLGQAAWVVQCFHGLFLLQLLLGVRRVMLGDKKNNAVAWLGLAAVASLPMTVLFSVVFYQDVPATAQVVWAFYYLRQKKWIKSALFLSLAVSLKENMLLFVPGYGLALIRVYWGHWLRMLRASVGSMLMVLAACAAMALTLHSRGLEYYPMRNVDVICNRVSAAFSSAKPPKAVTKGGDPKKGEAPKKAPSLSLYSDDVIANHPGDLRIPRNWVLYGGGIAPLVLLLACLGWFQRRRALARDALAEKDDVMDAVMLIGGCTDLLLTYYMLRTSPDARFFFPGAVLCLMGIIRVAHSAPLRKVWLPCLMLAALLQAGAVLAQTWTLRRVPNGIAEAITYLEQHPPRSNRVFMYPEGNYRLFPTSHDWYLGNELRSLWKGDNDDRLALLHKRHVGAIVVKNHLVGPIDADMNNLGVYPEAFVDDLENDSRFIKVLENKAVRIYTVPAAAKP
jgi:hypothetical protein